MRALLKASFVATSSVAMKQCCEYGRKLYKGGENAGNDKRDTLCLMSLMLAWDTSDIPFFSCSIVDKFFVRSAPANSFCWVNRGRETERETDREKERERERERQRERQTERKRKREKKREREAEREEDVDNEGEGGEGIVTIFLSPRGRAYPVSKKCVLISKGNPQIRRDLHRWARC